MLFITSFRKKIICKKRSSLLFLLLLKNCIYFNLRSQEYFLLFKESIFRLYFLSVTRIYPPTQPLAPTWRSAWEKSIWDLTTKHLIHEKKTWNYKKNYPYFFSNNIIMNSIMNKQKSPEIAHETIWTTGLFRTQSNIYDGVFLRK